MASRKLIVEVIGDARSLERSFKRASKASQTFGRTMERSTVSASLGLRGLGRQVAGVSAAFLGGAGLVASVKSSSEAASHLAEMVSRTNVVFGESAKVVQAYATDALGLAKDQALEATSAFGALLRPLGVTGKEAAKTSIQLAKLAVDLSSFADVPIQDTLDAIRSGLVGETEPLRRFGILLSEARVQAEAFRVTGKKSAKQLTDQEKVQARVNLIYKDASQAAGDYDRTLGGLANQQREFQKNVRNLQIAIGTALNPVVLEVTRNLNKWLGRPENVARFQQAIQSAAATVRSLAQTADRVAGAVGGWKEAITAVTGLFVGMKLAGVASAAAILVANKLAAAGTAAAWRAALVATGWGALVVAATVAATEIVAHWEQVKRFFDKFWRDLKTDAFNAFLAVVEPFSHLPDAMGQWARDAKNAVLRELGEIEDAAARAAGTLAPISERALEAARRAGTRPRARGGAPAAAAAAGAAVARTVRDVAAIPWLQYRLALAEATKTLKDDLRVTNEIIRVLTQRLAGTKTLRERTELLQALNRYAGQAAALTGEIRNANQAIKEAERERRREASRRAARRAETRQFGLLGLGPGGAELVPNAASLRKTFNRLQAFVKTQEPVVRKMFENIRKVLFGGEKPRPAVLAWIDDWFDAIDEKFRERSRDLPVRRWKQLSTDRIAAALGLTEQQKRALSYMLAGGGAAPPRSSGQFAFAGGGTTINGPVHVYGVTNLRQFEEEMAKRTKARPHQRRGAR